MLKLRQVTLPPARSPPREVAIPQFMGFHDYLKFPDEAIQHFAQEAKDERLISSAFVRSNCFATAVVTCTACSRHWTPKPCAVTAPLSASPAGIARSIRRPLGRTQHSNTLERRQDAQHRVRSQAKKANLAEKV